MVLIDISFQSLLFPLSFFREFSLSMSIEMPYEIINLSSSHRIKTKVSNIVLLKKLKKHEVAYINSISKNMKYPTLTVLVQT